MKHEAPVILFALIRNGLAMGSITTGNVAKTGKQL